MRTIHPSRRQARALAALVLLAAAPPLNAGTSPDGDTCRVLEVDPVELILTGREVEGQPRLSLTRDGISYRFVDEDNLAAFERDPARFEIQLGGSCARMGPLSGACSTEHRAVHDGRLYVFASRQCRESFLKAPERMLETDDAAPAATPESARRGQELLERALTTLGGAEAVDGVRNYAERAERSQLEGGREYRVADGAWLVFEPGAPLPDRLRREQSWDDATWASVIARGRGAKVSGDRRTPMAATQRRAFEREMGRMLLAVLRSRGAPGAVVAHAGAGQLEGAPVELVAVAVDGRTTMLVLDARDGAVRALRYRGRTSQEALADLEVRLSDWRSVGALRLPFTRTVFADGAAQPDGSMTLGTIVLDGALDADLFRTTR